MLAPPKIFLMNSVMDISTDILKSRSIYFSSPELKAQVSFSDLYVCKLFTFPSSSPEPLGWFQPNLAQSILGWRDLNSYKWRVIPFSKRPFSPEPLRLNYKKNQVCSNGELRGVDFDLFIITLTRFNNLFSALPSQY